MHVRCCLLVNSVCVSAIINTSALLSTTGLPASWCTFTRRPLGLVQIPVGYSIHLHAEQAREYVNVIFYIVGIYLYMYVY